MAYGFIYIWFDRVKKRFYIGSHWGTEDDGYVCSSNWMKKAYSHRSRDFKRRILSRIYTTRDDLLKEEQRWLDMIKPEEIKRGENSRYYNLNLKTAGWWTDEDRYKTIAEKISEATKEAMWRPEVREKYLEGYNHRAPMSEEARKRQGETLRLKNLERFPMENRYKPLQGDELIERHRQNTTEMWKTRDRVEHGKKISEAKKAKGTSPESRERYRQAALKREAAKRAK